MAPRVPLRFLAVLLLLSAVATALVSEGHGAPRHRLPDADADAAGGGEHRSLGIVERTTRNAVAAARWSVSVRKGGGHGGGHGHGRGHGRGRGSGNRGHGGGTPETPAVFYPRTVTAGNGNLNHGRSAATSTMTMTAGPGQPAARAILLAAAAVLLLLLRL